MPPNTRGTRSTGDQQLVLVLVLVCIQCVATQWGPGTGPWQVVEPASIGLSPDLIAGAEVEINRDVGNRSCFLLVKDGKIVYEKYRLGTRETTMHPLFSITKSACAQLIGISVQQEWGNTGDTLGDKLTDVRQCNPDATVENVLTMTARSVDMRTPEFEYDSSGELCLDTLSDYISENNPDGLGSSAWMERYWAGPLGLENYDWSNGTASKDVGCGYTLTASCRDVARLGQLWANNGVWDENGIDKLMPSQYSEKAGSWVFPLATDAIYPYGYLQWLFQWSDDDDVDHEVKTMAGRGGQCGIISKKHNLVMVSLGLDSSEDQAYACKTVWNLAKVAGTSVDNKSRRNHVAYDYVIATSLTVVVVAVAFIGFAGWRAYKKNQEKRLQAEHVPPTEKTQLFADTIDA